MPNSVWYSFIKRNGRDPYKIIEEMHRNFKKHKLAKDTQVVQFYDNNSGELITEYKE